MSGHVRDRLSAYLDQELVPAERTAVETHLHGCEACRQHLETLAVVDAAARALPVVAPAGYFDTLPGRVRARLERPAPRVRHVPLRLPAWTWAVAAVLVLGVVTPLTMVSLWSSREGPIPAPRPEALAPPTVAASPLADARGGEKEEMQPGTADELKLRQAAPASAAAKAQPPKRDSIPSAGEGQDAFAPPPPAAPAEAAAVTTPAAPAAAPPPAPAPGRVARRPGPGGPHAQTQAQTQAQAGEAGNLASATRAGESLAADAEAEKRRAEPQAAPEARTLAKASREEDAAGLREEIVHEEMRLRADQPRADSAETEYRRLLVAPAQTVAALRSRREAWRAFALRFPESPRADEARVRLVEMGAAAWRLSHDPDDRARVREDAAAYLDRRDAAHAPQVRAILQKVETP